MTDPLHGMPARAGVTTCRYAPVATSRHETTTTATTLSSEHLFVAVLATDRVQRRLFRRLSASDKCSVRRLSSACCRVVTRRLFARVQVTFGPSSFTKPCRVAALGRIGQHIEHLVFRMPHSEATFLPPLVHPVTGREMSFLYTPHTSMGSVLTRPKYANAELGDVLTQQYPPLFHAATNVASFINAFRALANVRHLTVCCPGQDPRERYRRGIVDYALVSLRIAVESAPLARLTSLSLSSVHPAAFHYLRHAHGFGALPSAGRRWGQVRRLDVSVEAWAFDGSSPGADHLKIMDDYLRFFAPRLDSFVFSWVGNRGPCPVVTLGSAASADQGLSRKLFHEITSPMSPLPRTPPARPPIYFPQLRYLQLRNAAMSAPQLAAFIEAHRPTVKEFDFDNVVLTNHGSWEDALACLSRDDSWTRSSLSAAPTAPAAAPECSFVSHDSVEELPRPSAAVEAAGHELMNSDLGANNDEPPISVQEDLSATDVPLTSPDVSQGFTTKICRKKRKKKKKTGSHHRHHQHHQHHHRRHHHHHRKKHTGDTSSSPCAPEAISAPMLASNPQPVLLQPAVYDPCRSSPGGGGDDGITSVQRNLEQEEAHRLLAHDAAARAKVLQNAKEAVLSKLSREFCAKRDRAADAAAAAACRLMVRSGYVRLDDRRVRESQTALVPLIFCRS